MSAKQLFSKFINEPTNYTESSSSIIDLIMVSNLQPVDISGVGEPYKIPLPNILHI